jgi:DNA-binding NarL/FixJ family response regulator
MTATGWPGCAGTRARLTSAAMTSEGAGAGRIRVLLADDDALFLESLQPLVEGQDGLEVVATAGDGLAALELVDELRPDAVVMDLHMPLLDGVTAVTRLRRDHPSLCLIALTGDQAPELHRAVDEAGADAVLIKDELVQTLLDRLSAARDR